VVPEITRARGALEQAQRIERPAALHGQLPQEEGFGIHGAGRGVKLVARSAQEENGRAEAEHDGGKKVGEPETDVALGVNHTDLASQGAHIDHQVEVQIDARDCGSGVDNDALAVGLHSNIRFLVSILLCDQGRNIGPAMEISCGSDNVM
jgi:hypothetical protein